MMIKDGFVYCDKCGKPLKLDMGVYLYADWDKDIRHYCQRCRSTIPDPKPPIIERIHRWFKRWLS